MKIKNLQIKKRVVFKANNKINMGNPHAHKGGSTIACDTMTGTGSANTF